MTPTFATDTSYFQVGLDDTYPHPWVIFRACDGTYRDPMHGRNLAWAKKAAKSGRIAGYTIYCVFRPGQATFATVRDMLGEPDAHVTVMIDVESWRGEIKGDHSAAITALAEQFAVLLGDRHRVLAYGNQGDLASIYPHRPGWLRLIVASYGSVQPQVKNMIGWQYSDGQAKWARPAGYPRSSKPFGHCDHNVFPGLSPAQLATALGVGKAHPSPKPAKAPTSVPTPAAVKEFTVDPAAKIRFDQLDHKVEVAVEVAAEAKHSADAVQKMVASVLEQLAAVRAAVEPK